MRRRQESRGEAPDGCPHEEQPLWRRDFPIDLPEDQYVARRDLVKYLVLASGAFTTGQLWLVAQSALRPEREPAPARQRLCALDELPVGGVKVFHYPSEDDPGLLIRLTDDRLVAYDSRCTHLSCPVLPVLEDGELRCPCHRGVFDAEDGRPIAGPPRRPLTRIELELDGGEVYATGVTRRTS